MSYDYKASSWSFSWYERDLAVSLNLVKVKLDLWLKHLILGSVASALLSNYHYKVLAFMT